MGVMTAVRKYTTEQRQQAFDLFQIERQPRKKGKGRRDAGRYTLKQIEKMTGVGMKMVWAIGRGEK